MGDTVSVTVYIRQIDNSRHYTLIFFLVLDNLCRINITVTVLKVSSLYVDVEYSLQIYLRRHNDLCQHTHIHIDLNQSSSPSFGITNVITHSF